jgi:hypothetical protein
MNARAAAGDEPLKRLGGGRWETRDGRFTIEPQSGTWALVDSEQTDELGLPLVRGPFRSLTDAKEAIAGARTGGPAESPLEDRLAEAKKRAPAAATAKSGRQTRRRGGSANDEPDGPDEPEEPAEPRWLTDLPPAEAKRVRELIERLGATGVADAEARVRADVVGGVPTVASTAIALRIRELIDDAGGAPDDVMERLAADVAELVAGDRDRALDVEWRLVDGDGRPIELTARQIRALRRE